MKKIIISAAMMLAVVLMAAALIGNSGKSVFSSESLDVIARANRLVKTCMSGEKITFRCEDFDSSAGMRLASITVISLPEGGCLYLEGAPVCKGQVVSRSAIDSLSFVFDKGETECSFEYGYMSLGEGYTTFCEMYVLEKHNFAPSLCFSDDKREITVASGADYTAVLSADDPDGDEWRIKVTSYPENGTLSILGENGKYRYTSDRGFVGEDGFSVVAVDKYGNESEELRVFVRAVRAEGDRFTDMKESPADSACALLDYLGIMSGYSAGGVRYFDPDGSVSREEFVAMLVSASGVGCDVQKGTTAFADEEDISDELAHLVWYAFDNGWLDSEIKGAVNYFLPSESITYEKACEIIHSSLGYRPCTARRDGDSELLTRETCALLLQSVMDLTSYQTTEK